MKKRIFLLFFFPTLIFAQSSNLTTQGTVDNVPQFYKTLLENEINLDLVESQFRTYRKDHPNTKNEYTLFYKHWRADLGRDIDENGYVSNYSDDKRLDDIIERKSTINKSQNSQWSVIRPDMMTFDNVNQKLRDKHTNVRSIVIDQNNPDILYCGSASGTVFRSENKGGNWELISLTAGMVKGVSSLSLHPNNSDILIALSGPDLWLTSDQGDSWTKIYDDCGVGKAKIDPQNPNQIFIASSTGLHRSTDFGQTWTTVEQGEFFDIEININDSDQIYALRVDDQEYNMEFLKSSDNGQSWTIKTTGWYSHNPINQYLNEPTRDARGGHLATTAADPNVIYALLIGQYMENGSGKFLCVQKSTDGGETWTIPSGQVGGPYDTAPNSTYHQNPVNSKLNSSGYFQGMWDLAIEVSDVNPNHILVGGINLRRSFDGGVTYEAIDQLGIHADIQDIQAFGNEVWMSNDGGISYSDDFFDTREVRLTGITSLQMWGFGQGWNKDVLVGGRYHNGNLYVNEDFGGDTITFVAGVESRTGYVNPGNNLKAYFVDTKGVHLRDNLSTAFGKFPSNIEHNAGCELSYHPNNYNICLIGRDNELSKSIDGGGQFDDYYTFGTNINHFITDVQFARSNPDVVYVVQKINNQNRIVWKSVDSGSSFTSVNLPNNVCQYISLTINPSNENHLVLSEKHNGNYHIWESTDSGNSWNEISSGGVTNSEVHQVLFQAGTVDEIYAICLDEIFVKPENSSNWVPFDSGLPYTFKPLRARIFYRDSKIRVATDEGIWESKLYTEDFLPLAVPTADKNEVYCANDTIQFNCYSNLNHENASWEWFFPGASFVSSNNIRNPKVTYSTQGNHDVTLTIVDGNGNQSTETISQMISFMGDGCEPDIYPGQSLDLSSNTDFLRFPDNHLIEDQMTISCWVKPDVNQEQDAGLVLLSYGSTGNKVAGLSTTSDRHLKSNWSSKKTSNLVMNNDVWNHVALVFKNGEHRFYLNGVLHTKTANTPELDMYYNLYIGHNPATGKSFKGEIDEVVVYKTALNTNQIHKLRHLTKDPTSSLSIIHYLQFNKNFNDVVDIKSGVAGITEGQATKIVSNVPAGGGKSYARIVDAAGEYVFNNTKLNLTFSDNGSNSFPDGKIVVSHIHVAPDENPMDFEATDGYWIINNYGVNATYSGLTNIKLGDINVTPSTSQNPENYVLSHRWDNGHGAIWTSPIALGIDAIGNDVTFQNDLFDSSGQIYISHSTCFPPEIDIVASSLEVCEGEFVTLNATGAPTIQWSNNIMNNVPFEPSLGTNNYTVIAIDDANCEDTSDILITSNPLPNLPIIVHNANGDLEVQNTFSSYQWYLDGNLLVNEVAYYTTPPSEGAYSVQVTNEFNCSITSESFDHSTSQISLIDNNIVEISPNPFEDGIIVKFNGNGQRVILIHNSIGQLILSKSSDHSSELIDLSYCSPGIYFMNVIEEEVQTTYKLVKK